MGPAARPQRPHERWTLVTILSTDTQKSQGSKRTLLKKPDKILEMQISGKLRRFLLQASQLMFATSSKWNVFLFLNSEGWKVVICAPGISCTFFQLSRAFTATVSIRDLATEGVQQILHLSADKSCLRTLPANLKIDQLCPKKNLGCSWTLLVVIY